MRGLGGLNDAGFEPGAYLGHDHGECQWGYASLLMLNRGFLVFQDEIGIGLSGSPFGRDVRVAVEETFKVHDQIEDHFALALVEFVQGDTGHIPSETRYACLRIGFGCPASGSFGSAGFAYSGLPSRCDAIQDFMAVDSECVTKVLLLSLVLIRGHVVGDGYGCFQNCFQRVFEGGVDTQFGD
jgi:hypothetical protein